MGETKKIVTEGYPVEQLPEAVRRGIEAGVAVRVTVDILDDNQRQPRPLDTLYGLGKGLYSEQGIDPVDYIRQLREEWD